jgi:hypothetical protein
MNATAPLKGALALLTAATLIGCAPGDPDVVAVAPTLPDWPAICRTPTPHADLTPGADVLTILARERDQLDLANRTQRQCAAFYDGVKKGLAQ